MTLKNKICLMVGIFACLDRHVCKYKLLRHFYIIAYTSVDSTKKLLVWGWCYHENVILI